MDDNESQHPHPPDESPKCELRMTKQTSLNVVSRLLVLHHLPVMGRHGPKKHAHRLPLLAWLV